VIPTELLLAAYASGWFPMADEEGVISWYSPDPRGIMPIEIEVNTAFEEVMRACAATEREPEDTGTWISEEIIESYCALHAQGFAHSVEVRQDGTLVGGLYGVALGGAFFGESMFHRVTDASKVALVALVDRLRSHGFMLLDTQWVTAHLQQFGAIEVPRPEYLRLLEESLKLDVSFDR
jgi:leucyl/phenylalanyl-tRNA--protein transferase